MSPPTDATQAPHTKAEWQLYGSQYGWVPPAPEASVWRLPIIRHVRAAYLGWQIERHYSSGIGAIGIRTGYDEWVLFGIFHGWV